jgi:hypothetical protein
VVSASITAHVIGTSPVRRICTGPAPTAVQIITESEAKEEISCMYVCMYVCMHVNGAGAEATLALLLPTDLLCIPVLLIC